LRQKIARGETMMVSTLPALAQVPPDDWNRE
jgi:hypothetical protein